MALLEMLMRAQQGGMMPAPITPELLAQALAEAEAQPPQPPQGMTRSRTWMKPKPQPEQIMPDPNAIDPGLLRAMIAQASGAGVPGDAVPAEEPWKPQLHPRLAGMLSGLFGSAADAQGAPPAVTGPPDEALPLDPAPQVAPTAVAGAPEAAPADPFTIGTPPLPYVTAQPPADLPPPTNDPMSAEPVVVKNDVPLPRPRPQDVVAPAAAQPASLAPPSGANALPGAAAPGTRGGVGFLAGLSRGLADNGATLMALGGGLMGAPSLGTGLSRGLKAAAVVAPSDKALVLKREEQDLKKGGQQATYTALIAKGVPPQEAIAAVYNPELLKAVLDKYYDDPNAPKTAEFDGTTHAWNKKTQKWEPLGAGNKVPTIQEFKDENGGTVKKQWNPQTRDWDPVPGFEKAAPPNVRQRSLTYNDISKMNEEASKLAQTKDFVNTFKSDYAGYTSDTLGETANWAGRNLPGASKEAVERAEWWQTYQSHKNVVRNELFGSALTATEKAEFVKADISPGMRPDVIKKNLERQQMIIERGIRRKAEALIESGAPAEVVRKAFGLNSVAAGGLPGTGAAPSGKTKTGVPWSVE